MPASRRALGFTLEGSRNGSAAAAYPMAKDEIATKLSSVRALASARDARQDLVTLCSACHNVIKQVNSECRTTKTSPSG